MKRALILLALIILGSIIILSQFDTASYGLTCNVPSGQPDVASALAFGCNVITFDNNVVEPGSVIISLQNNIIIRGNGYNWLFTSGSSLSIFFSRNIVVEDLAISRPASNTPLILVASSYDIQIDDVVVNTVTQGFLPTILISLSNFTVDDVNVVDPQARAGFMVIDSNGSISGGAVAGSFYGIEVIDSSGHTTRSSYLINGTSINIQHVGVVVRDQGSNILDIVLDRVSASNGIFGGLYFYSVNIHNPGEYTNLTVLNSNFINTPNSDNVLIYVAGQTVFNATIIRSSFIDSDAWSNFSFQVLGSSDSTLNLINSSVAEDPTLPSVNVFLYTTQNSVLRAYLTGVYASQALFSNIHVSTRLFSSMYLNISNSILTSSQYNLNVFNGESSTLYMHIEDTSMYQASNTNMLVYSQGSSISRGLFRNLSLYQSVLQNLYLSTAGNALHNLVFENSTFVNGPVANIKIVDSSSTPSQYIFRWIETYNGGYSFELWSNNVVNRIVFFASVLDRIFVNAWPPNMGILILNQTIYNEITSVNNNVVVVSWWILQVNIYSSITGLPVKNTRVDLYDGSTLLQTRVTDSFGRVFYMLNYNYDESNPLIDQLNIRVSSPYSSITYYPYVDGGFAITLPNIFISINLSIPVMAFEGYGSVEHMPMKIMIYGSNAYIQIFPEVYGAFLDGWASVYNVYLRVDNVVNTGRYIVVYMTVTGSTYGLMQVGASVTLYIDREARIFYSPGLYELRGYY